MPALRLSALLSVLAACAAAVPAAEPAGALAGRRPNIILILTDDQGYGDLACHGNPVIKTPNLDRLHAGSVRFTDFHVSPTCAPTRSALLSGRHEFRNGITHTIYERERLTPKAITLPQLLKTAGYTTGIFGKWHLGDEDAYQPGRRGFDESFVHGAGGIGQTYPGSCGDAPGNRYFDPVIRHNGTFVKTQGYCTDVFFAKAAEWIASVKGKAPFYCHISPNAPHAPLDCPPGSDAAYAGKVPADVAKFYAMITNIDDNVGKLMARLGEWGIERDTLVVFITDNGTATGAKFFNAGMRGAKGSPWMGGTRVPSFWRWPGTLREGADVDAFACHWDFLPTLAELAGVKLEGDAAKQVEGRSLVPLLADPKADRPERYFVTHVGRWARDADPRKNPEVGKLSNCAVRHGKWTLVSAAAGKAPPKWELFDVKADPGQKTDVAASHPEVVKRLSAYYDEWWAVTLPHLENEAVEGPAVNPYKAAYWKQFDGPGPNNVPPGTGGAPKPKAKKKAR